MCAKLSSVAALAVAATALLSSAEASTDERQQRRRLLRSADNNNSRSAPSPCDPDECANPCTEESVAKGKFYHPHCKSDDKFVQCDEFRECTIMPCAPGTKWSQAESTCVQEDDDDDEGKGENKISKHKEKKNKKKRTNRGEDASPSSDDSSPWSRVGQKLKRSDLVAKHTVKGSSSQLYTAFGSDVTMSSDGTRMAAVDRYGDKVNVYEYDPDKSKDGRWKKLGGSIRSGEDDLAFETYEDMGGEYDEALAAAVISGDGKKVAVTSPYHSTDKVTRSGRVRVYEYSDDGSWTQVGNDIVGEYDYAYLGRALTVDLSEDGNILAVGDYRRNFRTGCVSVYQLNHDMWMQLGEEICGEEEYDRMGGSVSLSAKGTTVAVSVQGDNLDAGRAAVFRYSKEGGWKQAGSSIFPDKGRCRFGWPVSLSADGNRVAVSGSSYLGKIKECAYDDLAFEADDAGEVRVYEVRRDNEDEEGDDWTALGSAMKGTGKTDGLGWSLSLSGDGAAVAAGASNSDRGDGFDRGYARAYRYDDEDGTWAQVGKDIVGKEANDWTGHAVSLSHDGQRFAVGSPNDYGLAEAGTSSGVVEVYEHINN